jgi:hypothetical protein
MQKQQPCRRRSSKSQFQDFGSKGKRELFMFVIQKSQRFGLCVLAQEGIFFLLSFSFLPQFVLGNLDCVFILQLQWWLSGEQGIGSVMKQTTRRIKMEEGE